MNVALASQSRHAERGNAGLLAIILIGFATLTIMSLMAANGMRETRNLEKANSKLHEKWQARSALNILSAVVARNAPLQMNDDVAWAQRECGVSPALPLFDDDEVSLSHAAVAFNSSDRECNRAAPPTSLFGTFRQWSDARRPLFEETGQSLFNLDRERTKVVQMKELYRRSFNGGSGVAYVARYTVEAKFGYYRTRAASEAVFSQNAPACGTSVSLEIAPPTVERGQPVELRVTYESANRLQIYNSANTLIHEEAVTQQNAPATFVFRFSPAVTETYHVIATGSGGCQARSAGVTVTVTDPPPPPACPTINFFNSSANGVVSGSTVTLSWNVSDAAEVRLDGVVVPSVGNRNVVMTVDTTFTLTAAGPGGSCPQTRTLLITVNPIGPCPIPIIQFSANPTSVLPNEAVTLTWNVTDLRPGAVITLTGPAGLNQTVAASGTLSVTPPPNPGVYVYRLRAEQICGTDAEQSLSVTVTNSCPPPVIDAFVATPNSVLLGFGGTINLAWTISGTADSVSISNGVGGALPASGNVDIPAPVVDTVYTLTVVGCSQTRTAQVLVRVTNPPPIASCEFAALPANLVPPAGAPSIVSFSVGAYTPAASFANWSVVNADHLTLNGAPVPLTLPVIPIFGYEVPAVSAPVTYVLEAWNDANPAYRDRVSATLNPYSDVAANFFLLNVKAAPGFSQVNNHTPGETVHVSYQALTGSAFASPEVEIVGVASGLPAAGEIDLVAPARTRDYKFIARAGGEERIGYFTVIVEPADNMGPGWILYANDPAPGSFQPLRYMANRLSNGAVRYSEITYAYASTNPGGGPCGLTGCPPFGFNVNLGHLVNWFVNGSPAYPGIGGIGEGFPFSSEGVIAAGSLGSDANCPRIDVRLLGSATVGLGGFPGTLPASCLVDTRNLQGDNCGVPPGAPQSSAITYIPRWTEGGWIAKRTSL